MVHNSTKKSLGDQKCMQGESQGKMWTSTRAFLS